MVGRCANPQCRAKFHYLHEGRIFAIYVPNRRIQNESEPSWGSQGSCIQYFWLCDRCLAQMKIEYDRSDGCVALQSANGNLRHSLAQPLTTTGGKENVTPQTHEQITNWLASGISNRS
jgi:hypothetical protein